MGYPWILTTCNFDFSSFLWLLVEMIVWLLGTVTPSRWDGQELSFHLHKIEIQLDIDIVKYNVDIMKRSWGEYRIPKRINAQKNSQSCVESKQKNNRFFRCNLMGEIETSLDFDDFEQSTFYQSQQKIATEEEKFKKDLRLDFLTNSPQ